MDHLEKYLSQLSVKNYSPNSLILYRQNVARFFLDYPHPSSQITVEQIRQYQDHLQENGYSSHTISGYLYSLKEYYAYLEKEALVLQNPFENIRIPKIKRDLPRDVLSEEEMKILLNGFNVNTLHGLRDRALAEVLYSCALRRKEVIGLKREDLDLQNGHLRVMEGKGRKERVVPLGKKAVQYLKIYLEKARSQWNVDLDEDHLFVSRLGLPLSGQMVNLTVRETARKLKIKKTVTTHGFRRAAITHLLKNGANPIYVQRIVGHECVRSLNPYIRFTASEVKRMHSKSHPRERTRERKSEKKR